MFMTFIVMKENGIFVKGTALLVQYYAGALGNDYSIWKDVSSSRNHGTLVNKTIQEIVRKNHKISCAQFSALYSEFTRDNIVSDTRVTQEEDNCVHLIIHNLIPNLAKDLRIIDSKKCKFNQFWDICSSALDEFVTVDNRHPSKRASSNISKIFICKR